MDREMKRHYTLLVDFLGKILGPDYEVALHELLDDSNEIIAIANGELTGRHLGSPLSNKMLEFLTSRLYETQDYVLRFESTSVTGKKLCSNSLFIKDPHGRLVGLLCINFDSSRYRELSARVMDLCGSLLTPGAPSGTHLIVENDDAHLSLLHRRCHCQHRLLRHCGLSRTGGPSDAGREDGDHGCAEPQGRVPAEGLREPCGTGAPQLRGQHLPLSGQAQQQGLTRKNREGRLRRPSRKFPLRHISPISGKFFRHCCKYHGYLAADMIYYRQIEIEKEILTMAIIHANTQPFPQEVLQSNETVLVRISATWCSPCKMLTHSGGAGRRGSLQIVKVDVDQDRALALQSPWPASTLLVFHNGQLVNHSIRSYLQEDVLKLVQA